MKKVNTFIIGLMSIFIFGVVSANAATWTVTKSTNSDDGVCDGDCSLREAVAVSASGDTIIFNSNLIGQTFTLGGSPIIYSGKRIEIDGNLGGTNVVFLSGSNTTYHFYIENNASLTLKNMILTQGGTGGRGSILTFNSNLFLDRVAIRGNAGANVGAIESVTSGTPRSHRITNSSITDNTANSFGAQIGAIALSYLDTLYMSNTTVSGNRTLNNESPHIDFGAIFVTGHLVLRNCTITGNEAARGGGIHLVGAGPTSLDIGNTIVAGNSASVEGMEIWVGVQTDLISRGGNLIGDTDSIPAGTFSQTNDVVNINPLLAPINSNQGGHPVFTYPLQAGSPARNTGINSLAVEPLSNLPLNFDARGAGFPRNSGGTVDKGAFEDQTNGNSLIVSKLANTNDFVCDTDCSLREAVYAASQHAGTDNINFAANVFGTMNVGTEIAIENHDVNIIGYPALKSNTLIISGNNASRVFRLSNANVSMTGLTLANGNGASTILNGYGGAIYAYANSNLTLDRVIVRNNTATFYGAMYLNNGTHRLKNSTVNNNSATDCIAIGSANANLFMANATVSTNLDSNFGTGVGAVCVLGGTATIRNSTIAFNRIGTGAGGGIWSSGTLNLANTIVSNNLAGSDADIHVESGTITSAGGNLVQTTTGFPMGTFSQTGDAGGIDPLLAPLTDNGGNVTTHLLQANSLAINTGVNANALDPFDSSVLTTDARGANFSRIVSIVDKGAFETMIPTAATVFVSGRLLVGKRGLQNAIVVLTDQQGVSRNVRTSSFGFFKFENVEVGQTYVVSVISKRFQFVPQVVSVTDEITDLKLTAEN